MKKILYSLMFFVCFAFIYLVALPNYVQAGYAPGPVDCSTYGICDDAGHIDCAGGGADCFGTDGPDKICGSDDAESIFAGKGDDQVCAGDGNDVIHGGFGDDRIDGEGGDDTIHGGWGDDNIVGGEGDDTILAGRCNDVVNGGEGDEAVGDTCLGGLGSDSFTTDSCENPDLGQQTVDNNTNCNL